MWWALCLVVEAFSFTKSDLVLGLLLAWASKLQSFPSYAQLRRSLSVRFAILDLGQEMLALEAACQMAPRIL